MLRLRLAALALACLVAVPALAEEGASSPNKKTAFDAGEHLLQLPPLWVPVAGLRSRNPATAEYRPLTMRLTSTEHGMMQMCHRLPNIVEAFLFSLNREPVRAVQGRVDASGLDTRMLEEALRAAGPGTVKSVEVIAGPPPPPPDKTNQDLLALCQ